MTGPIIDRDAIIEKAEIHIYNKVEDADWGNAHDAAAAALPSIADDLLAPIEALMVGRDDWVHPIVHLSELRQAVAAIREAVRA